MSESPTLEKYPHIDNLTSNSDLYLLKEVVVTEKVDGTNARFGLCEGQFLVGGRNIIFGPNDDPFGFHSWVIESDIEARVRRAIPDCQTVTIFGEWFGPGIQKGIDYGTERRFAGFDICFANGWADPYRARDFFAKMELPTVPVVYRGPMEQEYIDNLRGWPTHIGVQKEGNTWEGVVITPTRVLKDRWGNRLIAKAKNPNFSEVARGPKEPKPGIAQKDVDAILAYCTPERLRHVLTALRERGVDVTTQKTTGEVIRAMVEDVLREATDLTVAQRDIAVKVLPAETKRLYFTSIGLGA